MGFESVAIVTALSLLVFFVFSMNVGRARAKYGIKAPATSGDPAFERVFRVHYNTMENLVMYLPALWMFAFYVSTLWASALGIVWIIGRLLYSRAYTADAGKRTPGAAISTLAALALLIGGLIGAALRCYPL